MKTTILEISEPALVQALSELTAAAPSATEWEVQISLKATNVALLNPARLKDKSADEIDADYGPKLQVAAYAWQGSDLTGGHDFAGGRNFEMCLAEVVKKLPTPESLAKRQEIERLKREIADLESAVRG